MRLSTPRIPPLSDEEMGEEQTQLLGERFKTGKVFNIFRTLSRSPKAYKRFMLWGGYILSDANDLPERERELVILRVGFNWKSGYEWAQHERIGLRSGLSKTEIARVKLGPKADDWSPEDTALLQATDELTTDAFITDETWARLAFLSEKQKMDLVMTVGQYTQVCMMLNSFGVQLDDDLTLDPDLKK
ncbi:carboxymuconolactone decarboxylase family protein [Henriciella sp. AS95]|uniref:carboxymuconolactone decarboxylase family protein n=1 Tax=Henriciella sp. AS95 TaxID=3135782 RepID=UPI00317E0A26